jgi:hypothetical protein
MTDFNPPRPRVPDGFRIDLIGTRPIVVCWRCLKGWNIPPPMDRDRLSDNAWQVLLRHRDIHHDQPPPRATPRMTRDHACLDPLSNADEMDRPPPVYEQDWEQRLGR